jgi:hypothetical protein
MKQYSRWLIPLPAVLFSLLPVTGIRLAQHANNDYICSVHYDYIYYFIHLDNDHRTNDNHINDHHFNIYNNPS